MPYQELSDFQLMALLKSRTYPHGWVRDENDAFREIIQRYQSPLLNFFRRLGADINRAEDCIQETFIKLFNYRYKYRPTHKFTTFLYTLARHSWADEGRRQKRNKFIESKEFVESKEPLDDRLDIQEAINKLSEKLRMTVVLSIYQGLTYEEIAEVLKIPVGTVKSRMSLAFQQLREVLKDEDTMQL